MTAPAVAPSRVPAPAGTPGRGRARSQVRLLLLLVVLTVAGGLTSLAVGSRALPLDTVVDVLFDHDGSEAATIVHALRVPRTVLALAVGAALGIAGALMQGHTRNPLADPGLLGVEAGASCAVVLAIFAFGVEDLGGYAWFALAGAGLAATAVFAIGSTRRGPDPVSLVLAGAAVSAMLAAVTAAIVVRDSDTLDSYRFWVVGSAAGRELSVFWQVLPFLAAGLLLAAIGTPGLNLLQLGDDFAPRPPDENHRTRTTGRAQR
jgi:iron complex transport system permease protein